MARRCGWSRAGPVVDLQRLVLAQDTGSAIIGAVRADYFTGGAPEAGELAGRLKQPLRAVGALAEVNRRRRRATRQRRSPHNGRS